MERIGGVSECRSVEYKYPHRNAQPPGSLLFEVHNARAFPIVTGKIGRGHIELPHLWRAAQQMTARTVKIGVPSPERIGGMLPDVHYADRKELVADLCDVMNAEFHRLAGAGASVFQVEQPWVHRVDYTSEDADARAEESVAVFNRGVRGLRGKLELWCHAGWGNPAQQSTGGPDNRYGAALEFMNELDVDVLAFECASSGGAEIGEIAQKITKPKIVIGAVDARTLQVERPEEVAALIRRALEVIPAGRLCITTDTGFGREGMGRRHAFYKMVALVLGANIVRREIGAPEADVLAADGRFAFLDDE